MEVEWWTSAHCVVMILKPVLICVHIMNLTQIHRERSFCAHNAEKGILFFLLLQNINWWCLWCKNSFILNCLNCNYRFLSKVQLQRHEKKFCGTLMPCTMCDALLSSKKFLENHMRTIHAKGNIRKLQVLRTEVPCFSNIQWVSKKVSKIVADSSKSSRSRRFQGIYNFFFCWKIHRSV